MMYLVRDAVIFMGAKILITRTETITGRVTTDRVSGAMVMVITMAIMAKIEIGGTITMEAVTE